MREIVLASRSPRRRLLLEAIGFRVEVRFPRDDERPHEREGPFDLVQRLARDKSRSIEAAPDEIVVAADTVVVLDGVVIGKPRDDRDAVAILESLSGRRHEVASGFSVRRGRDERSGFVSSEVRFRTLTRDEIDAYVATGEARDKAGAYGIQGAGGGLVEQVVGSYSNVVGLPIPEVLGAIRSLSPP